MTMMIKSWIVDKEQATANRYNIYMDFAKRTEDIASTPLVEDGYYYMNVREIVKETEKAMQIVVSSGDIDGSCKGWTMWVPKSQIRVA